MTYKVLINTGKRGPPCIGIVYAKCIMPVIKLKNEATLETLLASLLQMDTATSARLQVLLAGSDDGLKRKFT